jgi:hypothetical protein
MKLLGGDQWTRGDAFAFLGILIAVPGCIAAILAIPGMPKVFHWDSEDKPKPQAVSQLSKAGTDASKGQLSTRPIPKPVNRIKDVTSGQVNFGCDQTLPVETPTVSFGLNPRNVDAQPAWVAMDNVKGHNQTTTNVFDPVDHHLTGIKGTGTITGLDSQSILGVKNCPGGGHGALTLHVAWTEDQQADQQ